MKANAICKKTYPDEDDMQKCVDGEIEPCDVKIHRKGSKSLVNTSYYDPDYWEIID